MVLSLESHCSEDPMGSKLGDFPGVAQDRQPVADLALLFDLGHGAVLSQTGPAVNDLRQF
jgi:hypothetical protein